MKFSSIITFFLFINFSRFIHASPASPLNISAVLAFGDSTLDSGNNNFLLTFVRADHPPYGRDFPNHVPTGRFSNGRLITDFLVSNLNLKNLLPPSSDPNLSTEDLLTGVSFASAGSGLDDMTATAYMVATMGMQVNMFEQYLQKLRGRVGIERVEEMVRDALFVIGAGSNDMMMNYYQMPARKMSYSLDSYHNFLLQRMQNFVQNLYRLGGRKFTISGTPPLGCLPFQITSTAMQPGPAHQSPFAVRRCVDQPSVDAVNYNTKLQSLLQTMQSSLPGSKFAYVDIYNPMLDMIQNPANYGFVETARGCCGTGTMEMGPLCTDPPPTCADPSEFLFWDSVHPSEAAYKALSGQFMISVLPQFFD